MKQIKVFNLTAIPTGNSKKTIDEVVEETVNGWLLDEDPADVSVSVNVNTDTSYPKAVVVLLYTQAPGQAVVKGSKSKNKK